jgi:hypothetical protein
MVLNNAKIMKNLLLSLLVSLLATTLLAQDVRPVFIGLQPGITKEPFYVENAFDINVVPLVVEVPVSQRLNLRLISVANYHFGEQRQFSDVGMQLVAPVFLRKQDSPFQQSRGFYLAPVYGLGRNLLNGHYTHTVAIEPGYLFQTDKRFTLSLGVQFGGSYFDYDNEPNVWRQHFGPKVNLGVWL